MRWELHEMDCRMAMGMLMPADSVDSIVTDPPYGLSSKPPRVEEMLRHWLNGDDYTHGGAGFMLKDWDSFVPGPAVWREAYRVLKPGGHLVAFFGTRTYDMGVLALRLAGFEVRDQLAWVFGSGFPKSHDVSKGIDKSLGAARAKTRTSMGPTGNKYAKGLGDPRPWMAEAAATGFHEHDSDEPATPEAAKWQGWGTALKPAFEPIVLCRKPLSEPTVAANVLRWGTGALNIDGCRIEAERQTGWSGGGSALYEGGLSREGGEARPVTGRWPANFAHDGSDEVLAGFPDSKGQLASVGPANGDRPSVNTYGDYGPRPEAPPRGDSGSAARFFYCAKASKSDRNEGLDDLPVSPSAASQFRPNHAEGAANGESGNPYGRWSPVRNSHPTVKPTALMQWLVRMVTPPGGLVLDPFTGSGSTGKAAILEGFSFVGCEMTTEYAEIARRRIDHAVKSR